MDKYDVVIAGGSISGLLTAREVAKKGYSVLVLEEGFEIGTPCLLYTSPSPRD